MRKKNLKRLLPNFDLTDAFWESMFKKSKASNGYTPNSIEKFKETRYPKTLLFLSELYNGHDWHNSIKKACLPLQHGETKTLHSKVLEEWMGSRDKKLIIETLEEFKYIIVKHSYVASNSNATQKSKSKGYGIHPRYYYRRYYQKISFTFNVDEKLYKKKENALSNFKFKNDEFIKLHQEGVNRIRFDEKKFFDIFEHINKTKPESLNETSCKEVYHKCQKGKLKSFKSHKKNNTGQRIYNDIISLNKQFRYALELGEPAVEVEIRNAVPYFFATFLMEDSFDQKFRKKITHFINKKIIELTQERGIEFYDTLSLEEFFEITNDILFNLGFDKGLDYFRNSQLMSRLKVSLHNYLSNDNKKLKTYRHNVNEDIVSQVDILVFLIGSSFAKSYDMMSSLYTVGDNGVNEPEKYNTIKKNINAFLNASPFQRKNPDKCTSIDPNVKKLFQSYFPHLLENIDKKYSHTTKFHIRMQNREAKLMCETVIPKLFRERKEPFLGIHDGVICCESSSDDLKNLIQNESRSLYGIIAPVSIRPLENPLNKSEFNDLSAFLD